MTVSFVKVKDYPYHSQVPGVPPPPHDHEFNSWLKVRVGASDYGSQQVVQQLSGQKRSFSDMTRDGEGSSEWSASSLASSFPPSPHALFLCFLFQVAATPAKHSPASRSGSGSVASSS